MSKIPQDRFGYSVDTHQTRTFPWYALQVRAKQEMSVATLLRARGYTPFLPLYKQRKRWSDRTKVMDAALFPGYLFCQLDVNNRFPIMTTPGVFSIVGYRVPVPIEEREISAISVLMNTGLPSQPLPYLNVGDRVQIEAGPLRGLEGVLLELRGNHRLVLSITLLRRSVAVEVDEAYLKPAADPSPYAIPINRGTLTSSD